MYSNKMCSDSKMTALAKNLTYFTSEILHIGIRIQILQAISFITKHVHNTRLSVKYSVHKVGNNEEHEKGFEFQNAESCYQECKTT